MDGKDGFLVPSPHSLAPLPSLQLLERDEILCQLRGNLWQPLARDRALDIE